MEVTVNKTESDQSNPYCIVNIAANRGALETLTKSAYCLYMYFMQNQDGFTLKLRRNHAMSVANLSKSSYHRAMAELIEKGYIIDCGDGYEFYEEPEEEL